MTDHRTADTQPADDRVDLRWYSDWTTWSSAVVLLVLTPLTAICLVPFALIAERLIVGDYLVWIVAYFAVIPVALIPGLEFLQVWMVGRGSRKPTLEERDRLVPAWQTVRGRLRHGSKRRWQLRVFDIDDINATAAGGSLVIITSYALWTLPNDELEAVLAHELGHHAGMHPIILFTQSWLMRPILLADWLTVKAHNGIVRLANLNRVHFVLRLFMLTGQLLLRLVVLVLRIIVTLAVRILLFFQRKSEHRADSTAVALGFGEGLLKALQRFHAYDIAYQNNAVYWWQNTHPSADSRILKIQERLQSF